MRRFASIIQTSISPRTNLSAGHQAARHPSSLRSFAVSPMPCSFQAAGGIPPKTGSPKLFAPLPPTAHGYSCTCCQNPPTTLPSPQACQGPLNPFALPHPFLHSLIRSFRHWDSAAPRSQAQGLCPIHTYPLLPSGTAPVSQPHPPNFAPRTSTVPFVPPSFPRTSYLLSLSFRQHHLHSHRGS